MATAFLGNCVGSVAVKIPTLNVEIQSAALGVPFLKIFANYEISLANESILMYNPS